MPWPSVAVAVGDTITAGQLSMLGIEIADSGTAGGASIDFQNIPSWFAHLLVVAYLRGDVAAGTTGCNVRFNNDATTSYSSETLTASGATVSSVSASAQTAIVSATVAAASASAGVYSPVVFWVPSYANTTGDKSLLSFAAYAGTPRIDIVEGFWSSTVAANRITLLPGTGNWVAGSRATLYGLPGQ